VIHVEPQPEPPDFDARVRQPGLQALAEGRDPLPDYWRRCLDDLCRSYGRICAYLCVWIHAGTGARSVDHFVPKSRRPDLSYEWANYRLACLTMNSRKGEAEDVLDPFEVQDGWFVLEFTFLQVMPHPDLDTQTKVRVLTTIARLKLNDHECRGAREEYYELFRGGQLPLDLLERWSPLVARELRRQGRVA
jgi:hypothetical protein